MSDQTQTLKGFKVFNPDWTCRDFVYELGKEYTHAGRIRPCDAGFHFCPKPADCFNYYNFDPNNKVAEVEALGDVISENDKCVTNHIRIVREVPWSELLELVNTGKGNTGHRNSGDWNSGHRNSGDSNSGDSNSGDWNSGHRNSGDWNSGHRNSGHRNSGNRNSGHWNSGNRNSGDWNSGHRNSGDWNSCNYSSGNFCNQEPEFLLFNKPSPISRESFNRSEAARICRRLRIVDNEGERIEYKQTWAALWVSLSNSEKIVVQSMPNFDADVFEDITGIRV